MAVHSKLKSFSSLICFTLLSKIVNFPTNTEINDCERELNPEHRSQHKNHPHFCLFVPLSFFSTCDPISAKSQTSYQPTDPLALRKHCLRGPSAWCPHNCHISPLPPVLNCQSSTSFGSKFSSDVTIKRSSGYIICKKLELGTVRYRRDWGDRWITCCCLALSMKLRSIYFLLCTFLLESSIFFFSPQRHVKLCFHCCKAILLRLGSLKYFLSLPFILPSQLCWE